MKITERKKEQNTVMFADIRVGEVFRAVDMTDGYTYMKGNNSSLNDTLNGSLNAMCLDDGDLCHVANDLECIVLDAELIVSEVTE
jgi:hypothetical protein